MQAKELLRQFIAAIETQQTDSARQLLADDGFVYVGPNMQFSDADALVAFLLSMGAILKRIEIRQLFAEDDQACATLDYRTYFEPIGDVRIALVARTAAGRITRLEAFYNASVVEGMLRVED